MDVKQKIQSLTRQIGNIKYAAESQNRDLTEAEANLANELLDEISGLEERCSRQKPRPLSHEFGNFDLNKRNYSKGKNTMKKYIDENGKFRSLGDQIQAVIRADSPGGMRDARLNDIIEERAATGLGASIGSDGGFLLQETFESQIVDSVFETGLLGKLCWQVPMTKGPTLKMPGIDETSRVTGSRWGGVRGYWADEASEATASKPKFRQIELNAHKSICLIYLTDELIEDANALEAYVRKVCAAELAFMMDDGIINGTGAGQPLGILNAGCTVEVAKETSQANYSIQFENVTKMWSRLIPAAKKNCVWIVNSDTIPQLTQMSVDGSGASPAYLPAGGLSQLPYGTMMGKQVIECEQCSTIGDAGDIILAAFDPGYIISQRGGLRSDLSIHVNFLYDESVLRVVLRYDGQPLLRSAITPYKGTNTLSHFVTVADRKP